MALFVRRTPTMAQAPLSALPGPDWTVGDLLLAPGGRELFHDGVADRLLDPSDPVDVAPVPASSGGGGGGDAPGDGGGAGASTDEKVTSTPQLAFSLAGIVLFLLGAVLGVRWFATDAGPTFVAARGLGAFALFYVVAQSAERLSELVVPHLEWLPGFDKGARLATLERKVAAAHNPALRRGVERKTVRTWHSGQTVDVVVDKTVEEEAAEAQAAVDQARANRAALVFGFTAALGMALCGYLEADFLTAIGVTFPDAEGAGAPSLGDQWVAIVVTGLIVGGGSKALHDLISNISKASSSKEVPVETGGRA